RLSSMACSAASPGGTDRRRNIETAFSSGVSGGWPRPSLRWQFWQPRALNSGPSPSEARVEDGEDTHTLRNRALPSLKSLSCSKVRLAELCEKESRLTSFFVVDAPAGNASKGSATVKSVVGAVTAR